MGLDPETQAGSAQSTSPLQSLSTPSKQLSEFAQAQCRVASQLWVAQSPGTRHARPTAHGAQLPPQSTSLSVQSMTPSRHSEASHCPKSGLKKASP
jgi:hypothetical protein